MAKLLILFPLLAAALIFDQQCHGALFYLHRSNPTEIYNPPPEQPKVIISILFMYIVHLFISLRNRSLK